MPKPALTFIDEELAQSKARFVISAIVALLAGIFGTRNGFIDDATLKVGFKVIFSYLAFSGVWYLIVRRYPGGPSWRRNISLFSDLGIMSAFMELGGKQTSFFYPLFLWIIIGNGIRFGPKLMVRGIILGLLGFGWVLWTNTYWRANVEVGLGLLAGVLILPVFFLGVLRRLKVMHELRLELARSRLAEKAKDQFLAAMSHELRTPMNGVLGMADTLKTTNLDSEQEEHLEVITRSVESLLNVINDILDYSKITANNLTLESIPLDLKQILEDVVQLLETSARDKGVGLSLDFPDEAHRFYLGDPTRLRQIAFNLVGNAVKFTEEGTVVVKCRVLPGHQRCNVEFTVTDTGVGIPEGRLEAIFNHFEQADNSTTRKFGGTGLGLAISRQIAQLMDGDITAESVLNQGSTFKASLALKACEDIGQEKTQILNVLPDFGLRALVVEDNKFNQVVIKNILKRIGVSSEIAENGVEALEMLDGGQYQVIFMDVRMPVMNGYMATEAIRSRGDSKGMIPILALTGEATKADIQKCLASGMDRHLAKPVRLEKIVAALHELPEISRQRAEIPQLLPE